MTKKKKKNEEEQPLLAIKVVDYVVIETPLVKLVIPIRAYMSLKEEQAQAITKRYRF